MADVVLCDVYRIAEAEDVVQADAVDDFCRCEAVDLIGEDMVQSFSVIGTELYYHPFSLIPQYNKLLHLATLYLAPIVSAHPILLFQ